MSTTTRITFVTGNAGKFATAHEHLESLDVALEQMTLDLDEIQSNSVQEVALHKAQQAFRTLRRPVIIEDNGFYIDELNGFPGPSAKFAIKALGAEGIARLADQTATRQCHFQGVLVYIDAHGVPRIFTDEGDGGTIAEKPTAKPQPGSWSALWDVFVPTGCTEPLSALRDNERAHVFDGWAKQSVFTQFGEWLGRKRRSADVMPADDGRLRSAHLTFEFPADRIASRPRPHVPVPMEASRGQPDARASLRALAPGQAGCRSHRLNSRTVFLDLTVCADSDRSGAGLSHEQREQGVPAAQHGAVAGVQPQPRVGGRHPDGLGRGVGTHKAHAGQGEQATQRYPHVETGPTDGDHLPVQQRGGWRAVRAGVAPGDDSTLVGEVGEHLSGHLIHLTPTPFRRQRAAPQHILRRAGINHSGATHRHRDQQVASPDGEISGPHRTPQRASHQRVERGIRPRVYPPVPAPQPHDRIAVQPEDAGHEGAEIVPLDGVRNA